MEVNMHGSANVNVGFFTPPVLVQTSGPDRQGSTKSKHRLKF